MQGRSPVELFGLEGGTRVNDIQYPRAGLGAFEKVVHACKGRVLDENKLASLMKSEYIINKGVKSALGSTIFAMKMVRIIQNLVDR